MYGAAFEYVPRNPESRVLYGVIAAELESFLAAQEERDRGVPKFVEAEFRSFLQCGILAHGFIRVRCESCGHDRFVAFSCRRRGGCPSCGGRRMAETAAHLVDHVFPEVPVRQWVLSIPFALRYRLAYDSSLMTDVHEKPPERSGVLNIFVRTVFSEMRRRAKELLGLKSSQCGAVTFIQRFNDALNLAPHLHSIVIDGVYAADEGVGKPAGSEEAAKAAYLQKVAGGTDAKVKGQPQFFALPAPEDADVLRLATLVAERVEALFKRRGLHPEDNPDDDLSRDEPGLAGIYSASVRSRVAAGPNSGNRVVTLGDRIDGDGLESVRTLLCATVRGFSVHANCAIGPRDRLRLERLARYAARPAISSERLSELPDGRLLYRLKRRWANGTTEVAFDRTDFLAKLAALVPAPRFHLRVFHGILGPAAKWRPLIIPKPDVLLGPCLHGADSAGDPAKAALQPASRKKNYSWSQLLQRVFDIDISTCELCGGPVRIVAAIEEPTTVQKILTHLGLPSKPPPVAPPRRQAWQSPSDFIS